MSINTPILLYTHMGSCGSLNIRRNQKRVSLLTGFMYDSHLLCVFYVLLNIFIICCIRNAYNDTYYKGGSEYGLLMIRLAFGKIYIGLQIWMLSFVQHMSVYFLWCIWLYYHQIITGFFNRLMWNLTWIIGYVVSIPVMYYCAYYYVVKFNLPIGTAALVMCEQTRFLMKSYAFVRTNTDLYLHYTVNDESEFFIPFFEMYVYFSFAPTLIYKNSYPKSRRFRIFRVLWYLLEFMSVIYFISLLEYEFFYVPLQSFGSKPFTLKDVLELWIGTCLIGWVIVTLILFAWVHCLQNLIAELTFFADKQFYKAWWIATNIDFFWNYCNTYVMEWFNVYIYRDLYVVIFKKKRMPAIFLKLLLFDLLYELLFISIVGIWFPILSLLMLLSMIFLHFIPNEINYNPLMTTCIILGSGLLILIPHLEYFTSRNCPIKKTHDYYKYTPKLLICMDQHILTYLYEHLMNLSGF